MVLNLMILTPTIQAFPFDLHENIIAVIYIKSRILLEFLSFPIQFSLFSSDVFTVSEHD